MRVTFLLPSPTLSGGVKVVAIYAEHLARSGHEVTVYTQANRPRGIRHWLRHPSEFVHNHISATGFLRNRTFNHVQLNQWRTFKATDLPDADIVIGTWWETAESMLTFPPEKGAKVYFIQGHEVFRGQPVERVQATYRAPFTRIVVSTWLHEAICRDHAQVSSQVVPNGIDRSQFHAEHRSKQARPTVGFMYSPAELKGMDITTQVLQRLRSRYPDIAIVSFGSHAMDARLPKDLQQSISYSVNPPQERIRNIYASCDLWLTTSRSEGFNLVAAEAMACRTPVIATHTGWPVEAITNGVNGYCCPIDDVEALYLACQNILNLDSSAWQKMSGAAHDATHGLSWTSSCTAFEEILTKVAQRS